MSKEKSFWEKLFGCCSGREPARVYVGEEDDNETGKETDHKQRELPPQDLDKEYDEAEPGRVASDVASLRTGEGQDEDGDFYHVR
ncbi:MAG: hypothetical protein LCH20_05205, partial [Proteobacteria bacterium]|nr:hypothetical protein [Pseudomonadota bacterium]